MLWRPGIDAAISKHAFPSSWTEEFGATFVMIKTNTNATRSRTLAEIRMSATARQELLISFRVSTRWHNFILFGLNCAVQYYNLKCIDYFRWLIHAMWTLIENQHEKSTYDFCNNKLEAHLRKSYMQWVKTECKVAIATSTVKHKKMISQSKERIFN